MADKIVNLYEDPSTQTPIPVRFVDQGDGTWALKGSGGGGGAVTVADGADVTQGAQADAAWVTGNGSLVALLKNIAAKLAGSLAVTGTFWQATQPISGAYTQTDLIYSGTTALTPAKAFVNVAASSTDAVLVALTSAKKTRVLACSVSVGGTATNLTFNSKGGGAGTAISSLKAYAANGGMVLPFNQLGWFETNAGEALTVTTGAGSTIGIDVVTVAV